MGHEFVELKNSHAAIEAYRKAIGESGCCSFVVLKSDRNRYLVRLRQV
jgi:hypothetical protein